MKDRLYQQPQINFDVQTKPPTENPSARVLIEMVRTGILGGVPLFGMAENGIIDLPVDGENALIPIHALLEKRYPDLSSSGLGLIYRGRRDLFPDYNSGYISSGPVSELKTIDLLTKIQCFLQREDIKPSTEEQTKPVVTGTDIGTQRNIMDILTRTETAAGSQVKKTFKVGRLSATEVIPSPKAVDPLYCFFDGPNGKYLNELFEISFLYACASKLVPPQIDYHQIINERTQTLIKSTDLAAYCLALKGGLTWGELLFTSELLSGGHFLNGF